MSGEMITPDDIEVELSIEEMIADASKDLKSGEAVVPEHALMRGIINSVMLRVTLASNVNSVGSVENHIALDSTAPPNDIQGFVPNRHMSFSD